MKLQMKSQAVSFEPARKADRATCHELSIASQILYMEGQNDFNHGQISARLPGEEQFWLRGAALGFEEVGDGDFLRVASDGSVLSGARHRPPEWPIHTEIYRLRPEVNAIVHTHAPSAIVFGSLDQQLLALSHDACPFYGRLGTFGTTTNTILTVEMALAMTDVLRDNPAVLLKNHGVVVVGRSVKEATMLAILLERACALQLRLPSGANASGSPEQDVLEKRAFIFSDVAMRTYWQYFVRKLTRTQRGEQLPEPRL